MLGVLPSPKSMGMTTSKTYAHLGLTRSRAQGFQVWQHIKPLLNWIWHTTKPKDDGSDNSPNSYPLRLNMMPRVLSMTIRQICVPLGSAQEHQVW